MATFKKKELNEIVGGDITAIGSDRNSVTNSEIETGPVDKPFNDTSDYEKGQSTTSDTVFGRYRQNIPWFAVYSFGGSGSGRGITANVDTSLDDPFIDKDKTVGSYNVDGDTEDTENIYEENKSVIIKKKTMEERIEDLVKRTKSNDVTDKNYSPKVDKILDTIQDEDLSEKQLEDLKAAIMDRINNPKQIKKL